MNETKLVPKRTKEGESSRKRTFCKIILKTFQVFQHGAERHRRERKKTSPKTHENGRKQPIVRPVAKPKRKLDILRTTMSNKGHLQTMKTQKVKAETRAPARPNRLHDSKREKRKMFQSGSAPRMCVQYGKGR